MPLDVLVIVLGLALVDSINPSALAITLYLLAQERPVPKILAYVAGIFSAYVALGVFLMLGLDTALHTIGGVREHPVVYGVQAAVGLSLLVYALSAKAETQDPNKQKTRLPAASKLGGMFVAGVLITFVESSTALPYLAAIGVLLHAGVGPAVWIPMLLTYNLIFVLPPLALLVLATIGGNLFKRRFATWREKLARHSRETWLWVLGIVGFILTADALMYFFD